MREDHHYDEDSRVDVNTYDAADGKKYGIQVRGGVLGAQERAALRRSKRIMLAETSKLFRLPYTDGRIKRTVEAIGSDEEQYQLDLDVIAIETRQRVQKFMRQKVGLVAIKLNS